jgi:pyruvate/2-oxoglutarate dehydrogenase complex dihydrolipoamide acyltransferase (E2) component
VLLALSMPRMGKEMRSGTVMQVYVADGSRVAVGTKLADVRVDLSAVALQDCPPVYWFRMVAREKGWVRKLLTSTGETRTVGDLLALIGTEPDEAVEGTPVREFRIVSAGILPQWEGPGVIKYGQQGSDPPPPAGPGG